jgi:hypothetical protein
MTALAKRHQSIRRLVVRALPGMVDEALMRELLPWLSCLEHLDLTGGVGTSRGPVPVHASTTDCLYCLRAGLAAVCQGMHAMQAA